MLRDGLEQQAAVAGRRADKPSVTSVSDKLTTTTSCGPEEVDLRF